MVVAVEVRVVVGVGSGWVQAPSNTISPLHNRTIQYFKVFTYSPYCVDYILLCGLLKVLDKVVVRGYMA